MFQNALLLAAAALMISTQFARAEELCLPAPDVGYVSLAVIAAVTTCVAALIVRVRRRAHL
jgi:hypothetical protein